MIESDSVELELDERTYALAKARADELGITVEQVVSQALLEGIEKIKSMSPQEIKKYIKKIKE